jgi:hypothetical protein
MGGGDRPARKEAASKTMRPADILPEMGIRLLSSGWRSARENL